MPYIHQAQAKLNEMVDRTTEYSIPYDEIIGVLQRGGFQGYLSSDYEGNQHIQGKFEVDSVEQLRRHQVIMPGLLGEKEENH